MTSCKADRAKPSHHFLSYFNRYLRSPHLRHSDRSVKVAKSITAFFVSVDSVEEPGCSIDHHPCSFIPTIQFRKAKRYPLSEGFSLLYPFSPFLQKPPGCSNARCSNKYSGTVETLHCNVETSPLFTYQVLLFNRKVLEVYQASAESVPPQSLKYRICVSILLPTFFPWYSCKGTETRMPLAPSPCQ